MTYPYDPSGLVSPVFPKTDFAPIGALPANKTAVASDWNAFGQALEDIRAALRAVLNTNADVTLTTERVINVDASLGNRIIILPLAAFPVSLPLLIRKTDSTANTVEVRRQASDTVDSGTSIFLTLSSPGAVLAPNGSTAWRSYGNTVSAPAINAQSGTSYTLALADAQSLIIFSNAATITVTVPPNSSVAYPVGTRVDVSQGAAGKVTLAQGAGVTINSKSGNKSTAAQYVALSLFKTATNTWLLVGDLIA